MAGILLWLMGVPLIVIILLYLLFERGRRAAVLSPRYPPLAPVRQ